MLWMTFVSKLTLLSNIINDPHCNLEGFEADE